MVSGIGFGDRLVDRRSGIICMNMLIAFWVR